MLDVLFIKKEKKLLRKANEKFKKLSKTQTSRHNNSQYVVKEENVCSMQKSKKWKKSKLVL